MKAATWTASLLAVGLLPAFARALDPKSEEILTLHPPFLKAACERYCPGKEYRILRIVQRNQAKPSDYRITFLSNGPGTRGRIVGEEMVHELMQYEIRLDPAGTLLEEEDHAIAPSAAPKPVLDAFARWNRNGVEGMATAWGVGKARGGKRMYRAMIVLNQIEENHATFLEDGTLVAAESSPPPASKADRSSNAPRSSPRV